MSTLTVATLSQWWQTAIDRLPENVRVLLQQQSTQLAAGAIFALATLYALNKILSRWSVNCQRSDPWNPKNELVLLTGGSSGIGKQILEDLCKLNIKVVVLDVQAPTFELPSTASFYQCDITSTANLTQVAAEIRQKHGHPTILINNAGFGRGGTILDESESDIRRTFEVNTISHFWTVKEFVPDMIKKNHGHIITIASLASFIAPGEIVDYSCTKAAALAFHEGLTQELKHWHKVGKVRTSIIHPLWVRTPMISILTGAGGHFKQRLLTPEMVSSAVVKQVVTQTSGQVILPLSHVPLAFLRALPTWLQEFVRGVASKDFVKLRELEKKGLVQVPAPQPQAKS